MKYSFLLILLLVNSQSWAQSSLMRIEGDAVKLEKEIVAKRDENGRFCAAIVVQTNLEGLSFDSFNGIIDVDYKPGQAMVFLQPDERVLEIFHVDHKPFKIILSEIGIYLKERETWWIEVLGKEKNPATFRLGTGKFVLNTRPARAKFEVEGLPIEGTTPYRSGDFAAQTYKIRVSKLKYETAEIILKVQRDTTITTTVRLTPKFGYVTIQSHHKDLQLFVDGHPYTFSPNKAIDVPIGRVNISIRKKYYQNYNTTIDVLPNDVPGASIKIQPHLERIISAITIASNLKGAKIYLNGRNLGRTPLTTKVEAGKYTLQLKRDGYRPETRELELTNNQNERVDVEMSRYGIVTIEGTSGAQVYINGNYKGEIPLQNIQLEPGRHKVEIKKSGFDSKNTSVTIKPQNKTLKYYLAKSSGRPLRITAFGNKRIKKVFHGGRISGGYARFPIALRYAPDEKPWVDALAIDLGFNKIPWVFNLGFDLWGYDDEVLEDYDLDPEEQQITALFHANIYYVPFVLFERIYPGVGPVYRFGKLVDTFEITGNRKWIDGWGVSWFLLFKITKTTFLKFGYEEYGNSNIFDTYWQINYGWTSRGAD